MSTLNSRQRRRPFAPPDGASGKGVDWRGAPVIDPTENVLALVDAESKFQNGMREAQAKYQDGMRESNKERLTQLSAQREMYESRISDILTVQVKTTSELISTQLDKVTTALGQQITSSVNSLLERIGQLERFRWEVGGRTSVQDPAAASDRAAFINAISALQATTQEGHGKSLGRGEIVAWTLAAISIGGFVLLALSKFHP